MAALNYLKDSAELDGDSAGTFYHLAIAQALSREIDDAILSARAAVERQPAELRVWHLLALLLTARNDWDGAKAVLDLALLHADDDMDDPEESGTGQATPTIDGLPKANGIMTRDFALEAHPRPTGATVEGLGIPAIENVTPATVTPKRASQPPPPRVGMDSGAPLLPSTHVLPPSRSLLLVPGDIPLRTAADRFEASLQLRMTQLALTELVDGTDLAVLKWPEVFSFFSSRCPSGIGHTGSTQGSVIGGGGGSVIEKSVRTVSVSKYTDLGDRSSN